MFTSWKTTLAGIIAAASYVLPMVGVPIPPGVSEGVLSVAVGLGLMNAKDSNVTGGTVDNNKRPKLPKLPKAVH